MTAVAPSFYNPEATLIADTECFPNFWCIGFKRISDGRVVVLEHSARKRLNPDKLAAILNQNLCIGYNWQGYDLPMIAKAMTGANNAALKRANDQIIMGGVRYWEAEEVLGVRIPRSWKFIDLMEPQPNAFASLKTLQGRLHGKKMQDLPYEPDRVLTEFEMDEVIAYMGNDLVATENLFDALRPALELRDRWTKTYGVNFMCKSDSQIGEGILKKRVEKITGEKIIRITTPAGTTFRYPVPAYLTFTNPELQQVLERLRTTEFMVNAKGKVDLPKWLEGFKVTIGETIYAMGIGGLHSTEESRFVCSDAEQQAVDVDVTGYYPTVIMSLGLYPKSFGREFLPVFGEIKDNRTKAKHKIAILKSDPSKLEELEAVISEAEGGKIVGNGVFGKTSSPYSVLHAPHMTISITLTGQLAILMLIDRCHEAGVGAVSANTDGVVLMVPRRMFGEVVDTRFVGGAVQQVIEQWEQDTGFTLEAVPYQALYSQSVNTYIAIKPDGTTKRKGTLANPRAEGDMRGQLMKNPQMAICSDAVVALLTKGTPVAETIRACTDIRDFVTVVNVQGGGTWRDEYLGKVVRYIWSTDGTEILYKKPHPTTGNFKKVSRSDGCRPVMELPDEMPADLDYDRYIEAANDILMDIGYVERVPVIKPLRVFKHSAILHWAIAV